MNPEDEKRLQLEICRKAKTTPEQLALALKVHIDSAGLQPGALLPAANDYAVANRLRKNLFFKAFDILKAEGVVQLNRQRRHELVIHKFS